MDIFIFIVVLCALIVVHEFGHFVAAKLAGMRVDEFGLGYPPRALTIAKKGGTAYTLNWLPFGGFVKIYGEDPSSLLEAAQDKELGAGGDAVRAFSSKSRLAQALVLVAGVAMNLLFAYILITSSLVMGTPRALSESELAQARNKELAVAGVLPNTPAALAGLLPGDTIIGAKDVAREWRPSTSLDSARDTSLGTGSADPKSFSAFVNEGRGSAITLEVKRDGKERLITATPVTGIAKSDPARYALGVEVATIGIVPLSFGAAVTEGVSLTWGATKLTAVGLAQFFSSIFTLSADLSQVSGPVGLAGAVGSASSQGVGNLFSIMALISINLALINLIPIPALDGGRLLFVLIESVIRRPIKASISQSINMVGFVFLILLMLVVTAHDIFKIVG